MAYRDDPDLEFLAQCSDDELKPLVYILTHDPSDNSPRLTEELTAALSKSTPLHKQWKLIAAEIQCFGADSWATLFRGGKGVPYREVLLDACKKLDIDTDEIKNSKIALIEKFYLRAFLKKAISKMSGADRERFAKAINDHVEGEQAPSNNDLMQLLQNDTTFLEVVKMGAGALTARSGLALATFGLEAIGLEFLGGLLGGPLGLILAGSVAISGAAYRVTIPACYMVAALRMAKLAKARKSFA